MPADNRKAVTLPRGWQQVALEKIASVISGQSPTSDTYRKEPGGLPFFQGKADFGRVSPTARVWCVAPKTIAKPGDILISVRAPVGPTNVADVECCIGRGLAAIRCENSVEHDFILFFMKFHEHEIAQMGTGSTFESISRKHLLNIQIPLPPLAEQKRIVAVLNRKMAAVEKVRVAALERVEAVQSLPAAWLREVFVFGGEGLPRGWRWEKLGDVCNVLDNKRKPVKKADRKAGSYPYYGATGVLDYVDDYIFDETLVLIGEDGAKWESGENTAFMASGKYWVNNHAHVVKPNDNTLVNEFLVHWLVSLDLTPYISGLTVPKLNQEKLRSIPVPLPPLAQQKRLIASLNAKMAATEKARAAAEVQLEAVTALPAALLREAFGGAL